MNLVYADIVDVSEEPEGAPDARLVSQVRGKGRVGDQRLSHEEVIITW